MPNSITAADYNRYRISPTWPKRWGHAAVVKALAEFAARFPQTFELEEIGKSVEGRAIYEAR